MRVKNPEVPRGFVTPLVPLVPILAAVICTGMIVSIDPTTLKAAMVWMAIGLMVYFIYSRQHSKLRNPTEIIPPASDFEAKD
jgi:APA family basic amino acid/polyamine antiporter